ncbi:MAG: DNA-binding protein [Rhodoferax sp.]|nr:DNA-binding protein [Rhodoferax sp.]
MQAPQQFKAQHLPLEQVRKPNLTTAEAAFYLNRAPQTLRVWSMRDGIEGLRPRRIHGLLAWNTAEVKALAGVAV